MCADLFLGRLFQDPGQIDPVSLLQIESDPTRRLSEAETDTALWKSPKVRIIFPYPFSDAINPSSMMADLSKSESIRSKVEELREKYQGVERERARITEEIKRI